MSLPSRLDRWLIGAALGADSLARHRSWRLARGLRGGLTAAHEALWHLAARTGRVRADPALVRAAWVAPIKDAPRFPLRAATAVSPIATALLAGRYPIDAEHSVPLAEISWRQPPIPLGASPLVGLVLLSLEGIRYLGDAYRLTARPEYLETAQVVARRWVAECLHAERSAEIWSDHITALRALTLCQLWVDSKADAGAPPPLAGDLFSALERHAVKLAHPRFHRPEHNHGVTQAYALLALGVCLAPHPEAPEWIRLGRERIEAQMRDNVSPEGAHLEHSPAYQLYVLLQFIGAARFARANCMPLSAGFEERLRAMILCSAHMLRPDGVLPALGDSNTGSPIHVVPDDLVEWAGEAVDAFIYAVSRGAAGRAPSASDAILPGGGSVFLRSGWAPDTGAPRGAFVTLRLATFPTAHIHRDVLSFELFAHGAELVVDTGGPGVYPFRAWLKSTPAHNTVVVDGRDQAIGPARLIRTQQAAGGVLIDAEHGLYPGVRHRRVLVFRRSGAVLLLDHLQSTDPHVYTLLLHLAPALNPVPDGLGVQCRSAAGGTGLRVEALLDAGLELDVLRGGERPGQGWVQAGPALTLPSTVLQYRRRKGTVAFVTLLVPEPAGRSWEPRWTLTGRPFIDESAISLRVGDDAWEVRLSAAGVVSMSDNREEAR
jgi:hypothetical protein